MTQSRRDKGRTGWKKWALGTLKWGSIAAAVLLVLGVIGVVIAYNRTAIPQPNELANKQVSIVYYSDGKTELDRIAVQDGNRESVPLEQGARSSSRTRTSRPRTGRSTRTTASRSAASCAPSRRASPARPRSAAPRSPSSTSRTTSSRRTGRSPARPRRSSSPSRSTASSPSPRSSRSTSTPSTTAAAPTASRARRKAYFGKDVSSSPSAEGAVLASVLNAPSLYDPANGPSAKANLDQALRIRPRRHGAGGLAQRRRPRQVRRSCRRSWPTRATSSRRAPTATSRRRSSSELLSTGLSEQDIDKGGLRIVTTIDKKAQTAAIAAMQDNLPEDRCRAASSRSGPATARSSRCTAAPTTPRTSSTPRPRRSCRAPRTSSRSRVLAAVRSGVSTKTKFDGDQPQEHRRHEDHQLRRPLLRHGRHAPDDRPLDQHRLRQPQQGRSRRH